jgi:hypothetical protein
MKVCKEEGWWVLRGDCTWKGESNYKGSAAVSGCGKACLLCMDVTSSQLIQCVNDILLGWTYLVAPFCIDVTV